MVIVIDERTSSIQINHSVRLCLICNSRKDELVVYHFKSFHTIKRLKTYITFLLNKLAHVNWKQPLTHI
jgi:hypothetical protein